MNDHDSVEKSVMEAIRVKGVRPIPRWVFVARWFAAWVVASVSLTGATLGFALLALRGGTIDWTLFGRFSDAPWRFLIAVFPLMAMSLFVVALILGIWTLRRTRRGYRWSARRVAMIGAGLPVALGVLFHASGHSDRMHQLLLRSVPIYGAWENAAARVWMAPERGLLMGTIVEAISPSSFTFEDIDGHRWSVSAEGALWRGQTEARTGLRARLVGHSAGASLFTVEEVRPWPGEGPGRRGGARGWHRGAGGFPGGAGDLRNNEGKPK